MGIEAMARLCILLLLCIDVISRFPLCGARYFERRRRKATTPPSTTPTDPGNVSRMSAGLVIALLILGACALVCFTCCLCWIIGRCQERKRRRGWRGVFESTRPFPVRHTRFLKDSEEDEIWRGPPPYETIIRLPSSDREISTSLSPVLDASTIMELDDDVSFESVDKDDQKWNFSSLQSKRQQWRKQSPTSRALGPLKNTKLWR